MNKRSPSLFEVTPDACFAAAFSLLILPLSWITAAYTAAMIHELAHLAALKLFRVRVQRIVIESFGAKIHTEPMTPVQEMLCAAAGPVGSLSLLFLIRFFPLMGLFGLFHGVCNLLPLYPMDGGRILNSALRLLIPKHAESVMFWAEICTLFAIFALGVCLSRYTQHDILIAFVTVFWILRCIKRKIPCKEGRLRVQ